MSEVVPRLAAAAVQFRQDGWARCERLLAPSKAARLCKQAFAAVAAGTVPACDVQVEHAPAGYGLAAFDAALAALRPAVERVCGRRLWPTYSYWRIYRRGAHLAAHRDRAACEFSVSVPLGLATARPWPLWVRCDGAQTARPVTLAVGDALVYRGTECLHWRNPFQGRWQCQLFLHYVDRDGPYADWRFDRRPRLGTPVRRPFTFPN